MDDDLSTLSVLPSDRKKLESMGITTIEQIALSSVGTLGLGTSKSSVLIQRARNILANKNIKEVRIKNEDLVEIDVKKTDRAIVKSILNVLEVQSSGFGNAELKKDGSTLMLLRKSNAFNKVVRNAENLVEIIDAKREEEREKEGIFLPDNILKDFAKKRGFEGFWKNVFSEIHGNEIMKKVIATSMFSTFDEPVHSLVIGEPGSSKTMAMEIINDEFAGITNVGANTTRSGLVCNLGTGDLGALPHSHKKLVLVDEFDKIPHDDIEYCYELLSNGRCSVHSAKIHQNIRSEFVMIAFANPKTKVFEKNSLKEIGLSPLLMSRCALIIRVKNISKDERIDLFKKKFYGKGEAKEKKDLYDQWVKLARSFKPRIVASDKKVERYISDMNDIVEVHQSSSLRRDLRMADYIRRIPMSIARASFTDVDDCVIDEAFSIFKDSIETWS